MGDRTTQSVVITSIKWEGDWWKSGGLGKELIEVKLTPPP